MALAATVPATTKEVNKAYFTGLRPMQPEEQPFSVDYTSGAIARAELLLINGNLFQESVVDHLWKSSYQTLAGGLRLTPWAQSTAILLPRLDCRGYPAQ